MKFIPIYKPSNHPWWSREFASGRRGIMREATKAGLSHAEAEALTRKLLDKAARHLRAVGLAMTVAMFRRKLVRETRRQIAEVLRGPRNPLRVSEAWREKYRATEPLG